MDAGRSASLDPGESAESAWESVFSAVGKLYSRNAKMLGKVGDQDHTCRHGIRIKGSGTLTDGPRLTDTQLRTPNHA